MEPSRRSSPGRRILAGIVAWTLAGSTAHAGPAPDVSAFEAAYAEGEAQFDRGEFREAAGTWSAAAGKLPESPDNRANRVALHEYIADAYTRALAAGFEPALAREGLAVLDAYAEAFAAAYPGEPLSDKVEATRARFRGELEQAERAAAPPPEPEEEPPPKPAPPRPAPKPWKGLAIGGGALVGGGAAMLAVFGVGLAGARAKERAFDDPANQCALAMPTGACGDIYDAGKRANAVAVAGLVAAPLLIGAGVALLVVSQKRRRGGSERAALAPAIDRGTLGLMLSGRF